MSKGMPKYKVEGLPGVYFRYRKSDPEQTNKVFYIVFRLNGQLIEQKVGDENHDGISAEKASVHRDLILKGTIPLQREIKKEQKKLIIKRKTKDINFLWRQYEKEKKNSPSIRYDECRYKKYLQKPFGDKKPGDITAAEIYRIQNRLLNTLKPATVVRTVKILMRLVNYGFKRGWNPKFDFAIDFPRVTSKKTDEFLNTEQRAKLLEAIEASDDVQVKGMMLCALYTGLRRGEIFKLKWHDIDFERRWITLVDPKGGPDQTIPLNDIAKDLLEQHPKTAGTQLVFPDSKGNKRKITPSEVYKIRDAAGLPKSFRPFHGLRHAYASMLASSGRVNIFQLKALLTHKSLEMTLRYAHSMDSALQDAANVTSSIVREALELNGK